MDYCILYKLRRTRDRRGILLFQNVPSFDAVDSWIQHKVKLRKPAYALIWLTKSIHGLWIGWYFIFIWRMHDFKLSFNLSSNLSTTYFYAFIFNKIFDNSQEISEIRVIFMRLNICFMNFMGSKEMVWFWNCDFLKLEKYQSYNPIAGYEKWKKIYGWSHHFFAMKQT